MVAGSSPDAENVAPKLILGPLPVPVFIAGVFKSRPLNAEELLVKTTDPTEVKFLELKLILLPAGLSVRSPELVVIGRLI